MINPSTYENYGESLRESGELVVYDVGKALVVLNEMVIKDPGNLSRAKSIYQKVIAGIALNFKKNASNWIDNSLSNSYIVGIKAADSEIASIGGVGAVVGGNEIINGASLIKAPPPIAPIPEIPKQIIIKFKDFENHTQFFGVFRSAAYYSIEDMPLQIMRKSDDIFRQIAVQVGESSFKEGDIFTRRQLSQRLLDEYSKKGLQTITYKNGRRVSIDNYCEMLGRTMSGRCAVQASINRYVEKGYDLGIVSAHFRACDLCTPYEGVTLSMDGKDKRYESIWDAELHGLWHPNCKHDISPFFEGITPEMDIRVDRAEQALIDEFGYNEAQKIAYMAQERQRYIERQIRAYKRREVLAIDPISKKRAKNKITYWQGQQREHLNKNTFLKRKYSREQIKKAH